ncbi:LysR family transcriptional regulator [Roseovarius spongiae]|uniref:LysR family transcriptional regulator n=1 Tax=Roseovarius spongiae TaxID=2320272 RepID=A0A3A8B2J4_9RHOB|nr:LysR family transcriptional regulator [Roseovarius spongiae]RKF13855.1 LysR family transcriptional regulator [Roseovarius spongiae]
MVVVTHLKSLQALELAIREGSLKGAAMRLGITPAAVGQRIRALEDYLGSDLLLRARSGLQPTVELGQALDDLHRAFSALERATETLDFQRVSEIHIVADPDWAELWLSPRLPSFRDQHPNILFCINGAGDVPLRLGAPDLRITYSGDDDPPLFRDVFLPVTGPDNTRRIADWDPVLQMEGMPLLHLQMQRDDPAYPGWPDWFARFGHRESGPERGVHYKHARHALDAVRQNVGFLICGLSLTLADLENGRLVTPFPKTQHIVAPHPYRLHQRDGAAGRAQVQRFVAWLMKQAHDTQMQIDAMTA